MAIATKSGVNVLVSLPNDNDRLPSGSLLIYATRSQEQHIKGIVARQGMKNVKIIIIEDIKLEDEANES